MPILALPTGQQAAAYLGAFAAGTIASMAAFSWFIGKVATAGRSTKIYRALMVSCATAAIAVGCFWLATSLMSKV